ncbi:MAG: prepilin peptidase [Candidatus Doudnabacteria bacterium]|nr:prepilin peptidase [Candidatus Doudnabacteria bacterium]
MVIVIVIVIGLVVGSFLNVVIHRLHTGGDILSDRSKCTQCGKVLAVLDLIPVISFVWLKGKCRYCQSKLSWQYPIVELTTALSFVLLALNYGLRITDYGFWVHAIFACFLIVIAVYDFKHYLILDKVVFPAAILALVYQTVQNNLLWAVLGALIISGFFAFQYFISKGKWIGFGDVKLGIFLGLLFAESALWFLIFAYLVGALVALLLMAFAGKGLRSRVPFGTILGFSAIIFMLYGEAFVRWYYNLLGL